MQKELLSAHAGSLLEHPCSHLYSATKLLRNKGAWLVSMSGARQPANSVGNLENKTPPKNGELPKIGGVHVSVCTAVAEVSH